MKSVLLLSSVLVALSCASARASVVVVSPGNMNGWQIDTFDSSGNPGVDPTYSGTFVTGPSTPPLGTGSVRLQTGIGGDGAVKLQTDQFNGTKLSDITKLSYSTFVTTNSGGVPADGEQASYVQIPVDFDGDGVYDDRLFFEPVYQTGTYSTVPGVNPTDVPDQRGGDGAAPKVGVWETYDILDGGFWTEDESPLGGPPLDTLSHFLIQHPDATIVDSATALGLQFVAGFGGPADWGQFDGNVDNVTFDTRASSQTFDFEPASVVPEQSTLVVWSVLGLVGACLGCCGKLRAAPSKTVS